MSRLKQIKPLIKSQLPGSYYSELKREVEDCNTLLDVGCGSDSPIRYLRKRCKSAVGVDGHLDSIIKSQLQGIHDEYCQINILDIDQRFPEKSFDCVLASDVIEHLPKEQGLELIEKMEKISRDRVIIFTPNGFLSQSAHSGNPYQEHLSGWEVGEMRQLGYDVIGINGWKPLKGELCVPRFHPRFFWQIISYLTQFLVRNRPEHAFQILCIKHL